MLWGPWLIWKIQRPVWFICIFGQLVMLSLDKALWVFKSWMTSINVLSFLHFLSEVILFKVNACNPGEKAFPCDLDAWLCTRKAIHQLTQELIKLGVQYMGLCCGSRSHYLRAMAEELGRKPPASRYSPDMSQHLSQQTSKHNIYAAQTFNTNVSMAQRWGWQKRLAVRKISPYISSKKQQSYLIACILHQTSTHLKRNAKHGNWSALKNKCSPFPASYVLLSLSSLYTNSCNGAIEGMLTVLITPSNVLSQLIMMWSDSSFVISSSV